MVAVLTFSAHLKREPLLIVTLEQGTAISGIFLMCLVVSVSHRHLNHMTKIFSAAGALVLSKTLAFFVLCIGVEIAWEGFQALGH